MREPFELYGGKVKGEFLPKSHRYYILEKNGEVLDKKYMPSSVTSISGLLDKSRVLMGWAVEQYTKRVKTLMGESANFTADDVLSMLKVGEKTHSEKKEKAASIGDYVHKFAEEYCKDKNPKKAHDRMISELGVPESDMLENINHGCTGFTKWITDNKVEILESEQIAYSLEHDYVGKFDAILKIDGKVYLTDYKTSNGVYNEHYYQISAYTKAVEEERGKEFDGALIVAIVKENKEDKDGNIVKKAGDIIPEFRSRDEVDKDFEAFKGMTQLKIREKELQAEWRAKNKK